MNKRIVFWTGISGVALFAVASILGGFQFEDYSPISQYISETMAIDTPYGKLLRFFGYIPSGILLTIFFFSALKKLPKANLTIVGFYGLAIFYGIATIIVGIFPCDKGCNKEMLDPSVSQIIHNLTGFLTYLFVPLSILLTGIGLQQLKPYKNLSLIALSSGISSYFFVGLLMANPLTEFAGLYQRIIEGIFIIWVVAFCVFMNKLKSETVN